MKITYDKTASAMYIELKNAPVERTKEVSGNVLIDVDKNGSILGIEILGVALAPKLINLGLRNKHKAVRL